MQQGDAPTAVNLDRTCKIMMTVMLSAKICMKDAAPSKMMVLATSIFLA